MAASLYFGQVGADWNKDYAVDPRAPVVFYMLPPIRYPDGKIPVSCSSYIILQNQSPDIEHKSPMVLL